jgi:hypothetical protein
VLEPPAPVEEFLGVLGVHGRILARLVKSPTSDDGGWSRKKGTCAQTSGGHMKKGRCYAMLKKSVAACLSAIEIYNKPSFPYRDETFAILMINGWELLLKARILHLNNNKFRSICAMEYRTKKDGSKSRVKSPKRNRSGNAMTIGLTRSIGILLADTTDPLPDEVAENITLLEEIRDNAIHYHNYHLGVSARIQEIGTASLRNYVVLAQKWFQYDLSDYNFYLMPMSFHSEADVIQSFSVNPPNKQLGNLVALLNTRQKQFPSDEERDFNIALRVETRFIKAASPDAIKVQFTKDAGAPCVTVSEEEALKRYPLDYTDLTKQLRGRYSDFKMNTAYYKHKEKLETDERLCRVRLLDPGKPKGPRKKFYSSEIIKEFDKVYTRKTGGGGSDGAAKAS